MEISFCLEATKHKNQELKHSASF